MIGETIWLDSDNEPFWNKLGCLAPGCLLWVLGTLGVWLLEVLILVLIGTGNVGAAAADFLIGTIIFSFLMRSMVKSKTEKPPPPDL